MIARTAVTSHPARHLTSADHPSAAARPSANPSSFRLSEDRARRSQSIETCACPPPFWSASIPKELRQGECFLRPICSKGGTPTVQPLWGPDANLVSGETYRLKTATTKTAINTTTPAAMIASSTFGIFNASFDSIQARPRPGAYGLEDGRGPCRSRAA